MPLQESPQDQTDSPAGADVPIVRRNGANNPNQALPAVVGSVAKSAAPKHLVLSHIANFDLDAAVADVKKTYTGTLTVGADLQCTRAR